MPIVVKMLLEFIKNIKGGNQFVVERRLTARAVMVGVV